jgi:hypothetical protein
MPLTLDTLNDDPLGLRAVGDDPAGDNFNPDNWLVAQVAQDTVPALPVNGPTTRNEPNTVAAPIGAATAGGSVATAIDAAYSMLGKQYVWGGTTASGVDCSGLLYYAFNAAGYHMPRYRAVDYGHMGVEVSPQEGRPGDIVYFDNPGDVDHVGIYLGNGKFIESPQPGQAVQVSDIRGGQIRRILPDSGFGSLGSTPSGNLLYHAPDQTRYVGAAGPGPQRDPVDQVLNRNLDATQQEPAQPELTLPGHIAPPGSPAGDTLSKFMGAVSGQESGGDYSVRNAYGAIGKYQVMYFNVGSWTSQALGHSMSPEEFRQNPQAQEAVARWRLGDFVEKYGLRGAAAAWYSGNPDRANDYTKLRNGSGPSVGDYVDQVLARMGG